MAISFSMKVGRGRRACRSKGMDYKSAIARASIDSRAFGAKNTTTRERHNRRTPCGFGVFAAIAI
jgi:hypothetical protein